MQDKLLTVSVAAYNVEKYLENTLESLIIPEWIDRLEVFVIDDGGKDSSIDIARKYEEKYPDTFHAIHKENGGYGSTVAYSIARAKGKFFKVLDGDDWFDKEGLIKVLNRLENCLEDVIVTDYYIGPDEKGLWQKSCGHVDNEVVRVKNYYTDIPHGMWALFYRTDLLQQCQIEFPLHTLYTDQLYASIPFAYADSIRFFNIPVYCYRLGRDEQSTSRISRIKHIDEMISVCNMLYQFYDLHKDDNNIYLLCRIARYYLGAVRTFLLLPVNRENRDKIINYESENKKNHTDIFVAAGKGTYIAKYLHMMRKTNYRLYWLNKLIPKKYMNF